MQRHQRIIFLRSLFSLTLSPNCTAISFYNSRIFNEHHFYLFFSFTSGFPFAQHLQDHQDIFTHLKLLRFDSPCGIKLYIWKAWLCVDMQIAFFFKRVNFSPSREWKKNIVYAAIPSSCNILKQSIENDSASASTRT